MTATEYNPPRTSDLPVVEDTLDARSLPAPAVGRFRRRVGGRHRRHDDSLTAGGDSTAPDRQRAIGGEIRDDRRMRLHVLAGSQVGVGCLMLAYHLQPDEGSPFASAPTGPVAWLALLIGITGVWLVPGLWLSAVVTPPGAGPVARLAARIGTTLTWYALVGPVIHMFAHGALVTTGGIIGVTVAATAAACLGVLLGLVGRPADSRLRALMAVVVGGIGAQTVIWLCMLMVTEGVSYDHIRRLDWLIVLSCGLLTAIGAQRRAGLPTARSAANIRAILISLAVAVTTAVALLGAGHTWSPAQLMPSAISAEQVAAPPGSDLAFALTAIGDEGPEMIRRSAFAAFDDAGHPIPAQISLVGNDTADGAMLLMALDPAVRPRLCAHIGAALQPGLPIKISVREHISGVLVQAVLPEQWCPR